MQDTERPKGASELRTKGGSERLEYHAAAVARLRQGQGAVRHRRRSCNAAVERRGAKCRRAP
eukprot:2625222-Lingulodinium_polyedra.AAC.1